MLVWGGDTADSGAPDQRGHAGEDPREPLDWCCVRYFLGLRARTLTLSLVIWIHGFRIALTALITRTFLHTDTATHRFARERWDGTQRTTYTPTAARPSM